MATLGLKFRLDDLLEVPKPFEGRIEAEQLDEVIGGMVGDLGYRAQGPLEVSGTAYRARRDVIVEARMRVVVASGCVRCLEGVELVVERDVQHVLIPGRDEDEVPEDDELALSEDEADEPDVARYHGDAIDLSELFREDVLLELPMNPTCLEATGQRCERYEGVLSEAVAGDEAAIDPRWAPLLEIKKKLS